MRFRTSLLTISFLLTCSACSSSKEDGVVFVSNLRIETLVDPLALDVSHPRFSWEINTSERNIVQTDYRILVASTPAKLNADEGDLWDSGKIHAGQSIQVPYDGTPLKSDQCCFWKVKVWCGNHESAWSHTAQWQMGLLNRVDWKARWIGLDRSFKWDVTDKFSRLSARYFRKTFTIDGSVTSARLHIIGLGLYELYVNGLKVGYQVLSPAPTDYTQDVKYTTFDLTSFLTRGQNAIGVVLGNGRFFNMRQRFKPWKIHTYGYPKLLFQLELTMADGRVRYIVSDSTWKVTADGPIRCNNEWDGEEYDATKELTEWNKPGYNDSSWLPVDLTTDPGANRRYFADKMPQKNEPKTPSGDLTLTEARRRAQANEDMGIIMYIKPVSVTKLSSGNYILDMGQNMAGRLNIRVKGPRGHKVTFRFAESLKPDGSLYLDNLREAKATDRYTLKGTGVETWSPSFVYHGFRYVEVAGWPGVPNEADFDGQVISDAMPSTGTFVSSDATLNGIFKNAWWSILDNYKGMPVDCPQRDERQPWLGDRSSGCWGESFLFDNQRLYAKWLDDIQEAMSQEGQISDISPAYYNYYTDNVTWPATYFLVAEMLYRQYGDVCTLRKHYPSMKKWMHYMETRYLKDGIMTKDSYGDWCMPPESPELIHAKDPARLTDGQLIATAYYYKLLTVMQAFAEVLDQPQDKHAFAVLARHLNVAFQKKFYHPDTHFYGNNTVTSNILPLAFGMVPVADRPAVFNQICRVIEGPNQGHIASGIIGTSWLMHTLSAYGRPDLAFRIATNTTYPSWGYMLSKGATTTWELWNGDTADPKMNSQNHVMLLGDLISWYYENLAGINCAPDAVGFKRILMKPDFPDNLSFVNASYHSMYGTISSKWSKTDDALVWDMTIPANTEAEVYIPAPKDAVYEGNVPATDAEGVKFLRVENNRSVFRIGSGTYHFKTGHR
ncbi:MAG: family 78 glycoside hydrolase catalytic domain [Bacteroidota bacterium]|nr:family 78 glycoside hydrolase catalytic domain [Bacteroidota bacterium]